jgi:hypothetical protein
MGILSAAQHSGKKDRRVAVYYFYLWDASFGPYADRFLIMPRRPGSVLVRERFSGSGAA